MPNAHLDLIFPSDVARLPKQMLQDLSVDAGLPSEGAVTELASRLWAAVQQTGDGRRLYLNNSLSSIYGGRCSIMWLTFDPGAECVASREDLTQRFGFDPFETISQPGPEQVGTMPRLIGITEVNDGRYLARYVVKTRVGRRVSGYGISEDATLALLTVLVDENQGFVEIRGDRRASDATVRVIQQLFSDGLRLHRTDILNAFNNSIEDLADALNGKLMEAVSKPDALVENLTQDQFRSVVDILQCVGQYLVAGDITAIEETLVATRDALAATDADFTGMPFMAVILAGMQKLNLASVDQDLRMQPLYSYLGPVLQHQGGYIVFPVQKEGDAEYTIRVGIQANTIAFYTPATEAALDRVRTVILQP